MYRSQEQQQIEHHATVSARWVIAICLVLPAAGGERGESAVNAATGRAVYADAVLRESANERVAARAGLGSEPKANTTADAADRDRSHLRQATLVGSSAWTSDLSVLVTGSEDRTAQSSLEHGHHVRAVEGRLHLPDGDPGLVQPVRVGLGSIGDDGYQFLRLRIGRGIEDHAARDIQFRPRLAVHQRRVHEPAEKRRNPDQHGWPRPRVGQCVRRTLVADGEVRGNIFEGLRRSHRCDRKSESLFPILQPAPTPSELGLSDAGIGVSLRCAITRREAEQPPKPTDDACLSGLSNNAVTNNLTCNNRTCLGIASVTECHNCGALSDDRRSCGKPPVSTKKEKRSKKERKGRPVETAAPVEIRTERGFPQELGKVEHRTLAFSTVPTGPATTTTENKKSEGSGSTLADLVFCPNNGVRFNL